VNKKAKLKFPTDDEEEEEDLDDEQYDVELDREEIEYGIIKLPQNAVYDIFSLYN
jgi:hypothetical protein